MELLILMQLLLVSALWLWWLWYTWSIRWHGVHIRRLLLLLLIVVVETSTAAVDGVLIAADFAIDLHNEIQS
jgi:hypothetical protein